MTSKSSLSLSKVMADIFHEQATMFLDHSKRLSAAFTDGSNSSSEKKKKHKKKKRPVTGFQVFIKQQMGPYREKHPEVQAREVLPILSKQWATYSEERKLPFLEEAIRLREEQVEETSEEAESEENGEEREKEGKKRKKSDKPRALSGFQVFMKERLSSFRANNKDIPAREAMTTVSQQWKSLSQAEKDRYGAQAAGLNTAAVSASSATTAAAAAAPAVVLPPPTTAPAPGRTAKAAAVAAPAVTEEKKRKRDESEHDSERESDKQKKAKKEHKKDKKEHKKKHDD